MGQMAAKAKLDVAQPNKSKDSPAAKKRQDLISQLQEIRQKQAGGKAGRNQIFDQIKKLDEQLKSRIAEQKAERARVNFKNVDELDREIQRLEKEVEGGMMKLVDERKALTEISNLKKLRKGFASFDEAQKGIDDTKAKIKSLKESLDDPEAKALSAKYDALQAELNTIKAEQDEAYKNISTLREEREKLYSLQQEKWVAIRKIKDEYFQGKKAYRDYEQEQWKKQQERRKAEQEKYIMEKKKERAEKMLAEARDPAYLDEIRRAESLLHYLDPTTVSAAAPLKAPSGLSAAAQRTVDDSAIKGMKVVRKDKEDEYFAGTGGKKGKKGRKTTDAPSGKFSCPPSVIEDCAALGVEPPMSHEDKAKVAEKVKEKLDFWKKDQKAQTEKVCIPCYHPFRASANKIRTLPRPRRKSSAWKLRRPMLLDPLRQPLTASKRMAPSSRLSPRPSLLPRMLLSPRLERLRMLLLKSLPTFRVPLSRTRRSKVP
jgi:uncharacterized coiled-coil DUF342 family protein